MIQTAICVTISDTIESTKWGDSVPIKIKDSLPAQKILESENIFVMTEYRAMHQDIRPLHVLVLNLMPTKIVTETQICGN